MTILTLEDHERVSAAIAEAERRTDGEIVAVAAQRSDDYHDAGLQWAALAVFIQLSLWAFVPGLLEWIYGLFFGSWSDPTQGQLLTFLLALALAKFLGVWALLRWMPLRLALVPGATKTRRVRRRAVQVFKSSTERRIVGRTGIVIYLSLAEHRAEIVHDEAISEAVEPDVWAEAMIALIGPVRDGRIADGLVAAIEEIGEVLEGHLPKSEGNPNEIGDRLIEL